MQPMPPRSSGCSTILPCITSQLLIAGGPRNCLSTGWSMRLTINCFHSDGALAETVAPTPREACGGDVITAWSSSGFQQSRLATLRRSRSYGRTFRVHSAPTAKAAPRVPKSRSDQPALERCAIGSSGTAAARRNSGLSPRRSRAVGRPGSCCSHARSHPESGPWLSAPCLVPTSRFPSPTPDRCRA
jgi:hypothetical protein